MQLLVVSFLCIIEIIATHALASIAYRDIR